MKTLYLECNMGVAGDMLLSALLELMEDKTLALNRLNAIGIPGVVYKAVESIKCGIVGTHINAFVDNQAENESEQRVHIHTHKTLADIENEISHLNLPETAKNNAIKIYRTLAIAESEAHNCPVSSVHFHEVGEKDAVADIAGCCLFMDMLSPDRVIATPVCTGYGTVKCAHGLLPVPAPATAILLNFIPIYAGDIQAELTTPTGAALLRFFTQEFSKMPEMIVKKIGYGMGTKDFPIANCIRAFLGETTSSCGENNIGDDYVAEITCNIDDMSPELIGGAVEVLLKEGATDVFVVPVLMKKSRLGHLFVCLCPVTDTDRFAHLILKHTTTFGVRVNYLKRFILSREISEVSTEYGKIRIKTGTGYGISKSKPEYEDIYRLSRENTVNMQTILESIDLK